MALSLSLSILVSNGVSTYNYTEAPPVYTEYIREDVVMGN